MTVKAAKSRVPVAVSRSAVTDLAAEIASELSDHARRLRPRRQAHRLHSRGASRRIRRGGLTMPETMTVEQALKLVLGA